jgi:type VI secretion system protein ImpL
MKRVGRFLRRPGVLLSIAILLVALIIWFVGPLIVIGAFQPLGPVAVRLACLLVLALAWGFGSFFLRTRRTSEEDAMLAALRQQQRETDAAQERDADALEDEFTAFREAVRTAMQFLRQGRRSLLTNPRYALPWYLVVGTDDAGKTSVIENSGINRPFEKEAPSSGATAHVHITDQAVFLELAGRLVLQDDRRLAPLWQRMLDHIKRQRAQQPINGVIVVTSTDELLSMPEEDIEAFGTTLRRRLDEATAALRTVAPVYLVVNKLDLVVGFEEFFESHTAEERAAVLGVPIASLRTTEGKASHANFATGFTAIIERFTQSQFVRLQEEADERRRRRLFEFTGQFAMLQSRLEALLRQVSATHRFGEAPNLRGVFFTSARQSGDFADMLGPLLATNFVQRSRALVLPQDENFRRGRPFFLTGLFRSVILPEASLAGLTRPALMMSRLHDVAANIALIATTLVLFGLWWLGFSEGRAYMARVGDAVTATRASISEAAPGGKMPTNFEPVLAVLDRLRSLKQENPHGTTFGLYRTVSVEDASRDAYDRAVANLLLPFVWAYLRDGLADPRTSTALRFQQLKFYLMLTGTRPVDPDTAAVLGPDFASNWLVYDRTPEIDRRIAAHFAELSRVGLKTPPADKGLINRVRSRISDYTLARMAYDIALASPKVQALGVWRPVDHMSLAGPQAMSRISGNSFWNGIPGIYTKAGLNEMVASISGGAAKDIAGDLWVMGEQTGLMQRERESARIRDGLLDLYRVDYISQWDTLLSDLGVIGKNAGDLAHSVAIIIGNPSPLKQLAVSVAKETDLEAASTTVKSVIPVSMTLAPRSNVNVAKTISEHYKALRTAVNAPEGQQAPIDAMLAAMEPLYRQLNHVATGGDVLELGVEPQTLLDQLFQRNDDLPPALQPIFGRIFTQAAVITGGSSHDRISEIWRSMVMPICKATLSRRYPFDPKSANDTSIEDFAKLFGPKGVLASFRTTYLKPFIDTSTKPWRWRAGQQIGLGYDDKVLAGLERGDDIATVYFGGQDKPNITFDAMAGRLDDRARVFQLDLGGTPLTYNHGPILKTQLKWPSDNPDVGATMSMMPEIAGDRNALSTQGPWALFRLLDAGRMIEKAPTDTVTYRFNVGKRSVLLRLTTAPTRNPFARDMLANYKCPDL